MLEKIKEMFGFWGSMRDLPELTIDLMYPGTCDNDPFYQKLVRDFHSLTQQKHKKIPLFKNYEVGVAVCVLPAKFDEYFMMLEGSARRNIKKAERNGFEFRKINYNDHLEQIAKVRRSTTVRQGKVPDSFFRDVRPCANPVSKTNVHDYVYFGVFKDGKLVSYAGCFICGEVCMIEHILGHSDFHSFGVVPMLIIKIAGYVMDNHPQVKYYMYDSYFGASATLRRFKERFRFMPHKVKWTLDTEKGRKDMQSTAQYNHVNLEIPANIWYQLVYRKEVVSRYEVDDIENMEFYYVSSAKDIMKNPGLMKALKSYFGSAGFIKLLLKVMTPIRYFYGVLTEGKLVSYGWITKGVCKKYWIEKDEIVIGPIETPGAQKGKGLAGYALKKAMNSLWDKGARVFYIDTSNDNIPAQKVFAKCGFGEPVAVFLREYIR